MKLTGDTNPIHSEEKKGSMIVPGLLLASTFPSLLSCIFPNCIYRTQKLKFASPVRCDQEVLARIDVTTVKSLNVPTKVVSEDGGYTREKALIISFQTSILRVQDGICVLAGDGEVVFKGGMDIGELVEKQAGEDDIK